MTRPDWIALDWGTSTLRAWAMSPDDCAIAHRSSDDGMAALDRDGFEPALLSLIGDWDLAPATPVVACGMVGARQGWAEAPYRKVPCTPLGTAGFHADACDRRIDMRILPGLAQDRPPDVMRGEEAQIAGFLVMNPSFDGVIALPGTHTKWVQISAGEVVSFQTVMTGELHAALSHHTVLRHSLDDGWDADAFADAVSTTLSRPEALAARLFGLRAEGLLADAAPGTAAARLSGLLIGAELAATRPYWLGMPVALIGAPALSAHYAAALDAQGVQTIPTRADTCTLAGLSRARRHWAGAA